MLGHGSSRATVRKIELDLSNSSNNLFWTRPPPPPPPQQQQQQQQQQQGMYQNVGVEL